MGSCKTQGKDNIIHLTGEKGHIELHGQNFTLCTWIITVPRGKLVMLILSYYYSDNSTLQIRDGQNSSSNVLESFSGDVKLEQTVISSGRHLWVQFKNLQGYSGFVAKYEAVNLGKAKL